MGSELYISGEEEVKTRVMDWLDDINADFERGFFLRTFPGEAVIPATVPISRLEDVERTRTLNKRPKDCVGECQPQRNPPAIGRGNSPGVPKPDSRPVEGQVNP